MFFSCGKVGFTQCGKSTTSRNVNNVVDYFLSNRFTRMCHYSKPPAAISYRHKMVRLC